MARVLEQGEELGALRVAHWPKVELAKATLGQEVVSEGPALELGRLAVSWVVVSWVVALEQALELVYW